MGRGGLRAAGMLASLDAAPREVLNYSPIDERPTRNPAFDAQRSAANSNDLRGKLLRIRVRANGGYDIPPGNLFPRGTPKTRPEIYLMGLRNPFRFDINPKTGDVYMADYSPAAREADPARGPAGHGRWMLVRKPANYGWPYCVTPDLPYGNVDSREENPSFTYEENGQFDATLKVTDRTGRTASASVPITVGNTTPQVTLTTSPAPGEPFQFGYRGRRAARRPRFPSAKRRVNESGARRPADRV
jgi:cytochrome c